MAKGKGEHRQKDVARFVREKQRRIAVKHQGRKKK